MYAKYLAWVSAGSPAIFPATTTTTTTTQTQAAATTVRFVSATAATTATSTATATSAPRTAAEIAACFTVLPRLPLGDISNL